ncbi:hypothetical protein J3A83DRAFT_2906144 [Scleroderma citrinum]
MALRHRKFRTKLCRNFAIGRCDYGDQCSFIHPPLVFPPYQSWSPFARQAYPNWGSHVHQYLAQQSRPSQLPRTYPQEPSIVDGGASPSSLLLSASDSVVPSFGGHVGWGQSNQKKYPCRHFVRTGGWCPVGDGCKFIHDYSAIKSIGVSGGALTHNPGTSEERHPISGGVRTGVPPASNNTNHVGLDNHGYQYTSLGHVKPYSDHATVSGMCWPIQPHMQYFCAPYTSDTSVFPERATQRNSHALHSSTDDAPGLPVGAYEIHGTTYFPAVPTQPFHFGQAEPVSNNYSYHSQIFYQPINGEPIFPKPEVSRTTDTDESEFPYRPPKNQQVGHARRISVTIKKTSGLFS